MALSKDYTLKAMRGLVTLWQQKLSISELDPDLVDDFINLAVGDTFQESADQIMEDYGRKQDLSDAASAFAAATVIALAFTTADKKINKVAHGLTASDVGKRIMFGQVVTTTGVITYLTIANILSIIDADNFIVSHTPGVNLPQGGPAKDVFYAVLPLHSTAMLDTSGLHIYRVRKIVDSANGEVIEVKDAREFENLSRYPQKQNKIYYYVHGEVIQLFKGANVGSYGTLTLHYYGYPVIPATEDDYLDIKDFHMPVVIQKVQNYILAHLAKQSINVFDPNSAAKTEKTRQVESSTTGKLAAKR
jgi:hypothetical protein